MTDKLRIGMIGLGGIATRSHLPALAAQPDVCVPAGAEIDTYQANRTQQRFAIPKIYTDYQEMLEKEELSAVYVCLPNMLHYQAASAALDHGMHVYCEKPVGLCAQEAQDLAERAEQLGLIMMPGYHLRFHEHFLRMRKLLEERRLGKILQIQASAVFSGPYRGWDPKSNWHLDPHSGGPLYDWGSHLLDLILFTSNLDIQGISAMAEKTLPGMPLMDSIVVVFQAQRGIIGTLNLAWGTRGNLLMLQIHGSAGSLLACDDYYEHRTPMGGGLNKLGTLIRNANEILTEKVGALIHSKPAENLYIKAAQCFIGAIRGEVSLKSAKWDAVHVHQVLAGIAASLAQGRPVQISNPEIAVKQAVE